MLPAGLQVSFSQMFPQSFYPAASHAFPSIAPSDDSTHALPPYPSKELSVKSALLSPYSVHLKKAIDKELDKMLRIYRAFSPIAFKDISQEIIKGVDYVVNLHQEKIAGKPSTIIKLTNDSQVKVIRK